MTGRQADVIQAAYIASEIAHRMVVPGGEVRGIYGPSDSFFVCTVQ